jgi:hypothetical protein
MLDLNQRPLDAFSFGANPPDADEIEYMRAALGRWQERTAKLRQRMASLTIEPPDRTPYEPSARCSRPHELASGRRE